jgi:steroid delta-isomerase-like uncharacterized protein
MTRDEILRLCQQWEHAFAQHDASALSNLYSESAVVESPMAGVVHGRSAVVDAHNGLFTSFPSLQWTFEPVVVDGDRVTIVSAAEGTHEGIIMGLPPTGRKFRFLLVFLLEMRDGAIVRDRRIYDFTGLLIQVGVLKAKPA